MPLQTPLTIKTALQTETIVACYTTTLRDLQVAIPSKFYNHGDQIAICPNPEGCLMFYPHTAWQKIEESLKKRPTFDQTVDGMFAQLLNEVVIKPVQNHRLELTETLIQFAALTSEVIWAETTKYVMLWQPARFDEKWSIKEVFSTHEYPSDTNVDNIGLENIEIFISKLIERIGQSHASLFELQKPNALKTITQLSNNRYQFSLYLHPKQTKDAQIIMQTFQEAGAINVVLNYEINDKTLFKDEDKSRFGQGKWIMGFTLTKLPDWCISYLPPKFLFEKHKIKKA